MVRPAFAEEALPGLMGEIFAARMSLSLRGWAADAAGQPLFKG